MSGAPNRGGSGRPDTPEIRTRPATVDDVREVFENLSDHTKAELSEVMMDPKALEAEYIGHAARGGAWAMDVDGEPVLVYGVKSYDGYYSMWSAATPEYYDLGTTGIRATRYFLEHMDFDAPLIIMSASPHEHTERWFNVLGFVKRKEVGPHKVFTRYNEACI